MYGLRHVFPSLLAAVTVGPMAAVAAIYSVPLELSHRSSSNGEFVFAPFDFGVRFAQIESLSLEFVMPDGYEGTAMTTGNSSFFRSLYTVVHERGEPTQTEVESIDYLQPALDVGLAQSTMFVPPNVAAEFHFRPMVVYLFGEQPIEPSWPDFMFSGRGHVTFIDVFRSSFHPLPSGMELSSSTSWITPGAIESARLTIVATALPEPDSAALIVVCGLSWTITVRGIRRRSGCSAPHRD